MTAPTSYIEIMCSGREPQILIHVREQIRNARFKKRLNPNADLAPPLPAQTWLALRHGAAGRSSATARTNAQRR